MVGRWLRVGTIFFIAYPVVASSGGKHLHLEKYYQEKWCDDQSGQLEVVLPDRSRVDCVTETHAVEVDFAPKWAEAIGQARYYGIITGKHPGILLIMENPEKDKIYWLRLNVAAQGLGIKLWTIADNKIPF